MPCAQSLCGFLFPILLCTINLEKLRGNREGQFSIRVNDQYRICFEWVDGDAFGVEIVDYH